ncbi:MAG: hypothetical protein Q9202_000624 [Teloschistes flavicans]
MADNIFKLMEQSELDVIVPDITDFSLEDLQDRAGLDKDDEGTTLERAAYLPGRAPIYLRSSLYFVDGLAATEQVIRSKPQILFSALPAISARVRYSNSGAHSGQPCVIASLDIETSPFQHNEVQLSHVSMELSDGLTEDLCTGHALKLPITCQPKDNIVFLFRLRPKRSQDRSMHSDLPSSRMLDILLDARVMISDTCHPKIQMRWKTTVDFSTALSPKYNGPRQAMHRSNRPASLPVLSDHEKSQLASQDLNMTTGKTSTSQQQRAASILDLGVTLTLTAPKDVYIGQPFTWDVFLVNRSNKARKLAMVVVPKRRFGERTSHMSKLSGPSGISGQRHDMDYAEPVMDENKLYALQKANTREAVDIVCLSTDLRLGNLNPGFCHNAELKFLPLAKGILRIESVRVIDLATNDTIDIHDLPEIVAEERTTEGQDL